jgi:hypothetical protein
VWSLIAGDQVFVVEPSREYCTVYSFFKQFLGQLLACFERVMIRAWMMHTAEEMKQ